MKRLGILIVLTFLLALAGLGMWYHALLQWADQPAGEKKDQVITIQKGWSIYQISQHLEKKGIINSREKFVRIAGIKKMDRGLKAGEFLLSAHMSPNRVLKTLTTGRTISYQMTIPEGYTIKEAAEVAAKTGLVTAAQFRTAAEDPAVRKKYNIPADSLEGYLFPDTYVFVRGDTASKMVHTMVARFFEVFDDQMRKLLDQSGMSLHEAVILASIIEKETGAAQERPVISSVFHNRLKKGMRLQSDPTVIYGIPDFDGNLTRKHLREKTPYNTYIISGLPEGPIANPGKDSLMAVLQPAESDYLYFVSKNDGTHYFSKNLKEHNQAVKKYQLKR